MMDWDLFHLKRPLVGTSFTEAFSVLFWLQIIYFLTRMNFGVFLKIVFKRLK
jgi:hypothetical protein